MGMRENLRNLKAPDLVIAVLGLALVLFSALRVYAPGSGVPRVVVEGEGRRWEFPLDAGETLTVGGPLGDTVVELRGSRVRVLSSPCAGQTCVAAGAIHRHGQWIACLPNRVMVRLEASDQQELDAVSW
ncbi:MAG: NusG domain II-containing protein [Treponema sp.]|jgi:hypothetical protein|nr:NusG domain II-containing protein [Treponema sp.]